ncbi:MAG: hypothetical protein WC711_01250 [Candidatus Staskawiczbacteria bacterium]
MTVKNKSSKLKKYVVNPLSKNELLGFLDEKSKKIIKYFLIKSLFSQPEPKIGQKILPIQIPKEHIEQWFTQALDVKPVGAGSYPIDIYNEREHWGADIKMLNISLTPTGDVSSRDSGEASLGQKFEGPGIDLDQMFEKKNYKKIKDQWMSLLFEKYKSLNRNYPIQKIYYLFILRPSTQIQGADFYFSGAVLDLNKIQLVDINKNRTTSKSVFLDNFIDNELGNAKIYKAKKRLELRLKPKKWVDSDMALKITTSFIHQGVNLRDKDIGPAYLKNEIDKINSIKIEFVE